MMRILIVGAGGFIGSAISREAARRGHKIVVCGRDASRLRLQFPAFEALRCDLTADRVADWQPRLNGIEAVVNAAGIFRSEGGNRIEAVHVTGPRALFEACAGAQIAHLVQISALGADSGATSRFHLTKREADAHCLKVAEQHKLSGWTVLRPSLVIGRGGHSTALFAALAALPRSLRLGKGRWLLQPLHLSDLCEAVCLAFAGDRTEARAIDLAGPQAMTTDELTEVMRAWLLLPPAKFLPIPETLLHFASRFGDHFGATALTGETLEMLGRGNIASIAPAKEVLGWQPRPLADALAADPSSEADRWHARLFFLKPALRWGLAALWITTAAVSAFIYPVEKSVAMTMGLGIGRGIAEALVYAGAACDAALGVALLISRQPVLIGAVQIVVIGIFTALATMATPEAWIEPFGPLTKNLAVVLATLAMIALESRP